MVLAMAGTTTLTVELPQADLERLKALAASTNKSESTLVGEALARYLEYETWKVQAIQDAVARADAGGPWVEHERVDAWLGSWGTDEELPRPRAR